MNDSFIPFFEAMEAEYERHHPEKGDSWKTCDRAYLENEVVRLSQVFVRTHDPSELIDIANMCAMAWTRSCKESAKDG